MQCACNCAYCCNPFVVVAILLPGSAPPTQVPQGLLQRTLGLVTALPALRELSLPVPVPTLREADDAALQQAITTWPQHLASLAVLDLQGTNLGPAATTALLYDMPSLTSLRCHALSAPAQRDQNGVSQLRELKLHDAGIRVVGALGLSPECALDISGALFVHPGGEQEAQLLEATAGHMRRSRKIALKGWGGGCLEAGASERMVHALAVGLGEGCQTTSLALEGLTLERSAAAELAELLHATPLVDRLALE